MNKEKILKEMFVELMLLPKHEIALKLLESIADASNNEKDLKSQLDIANKKLDEIEGYVKLRNDELNDFKKSTINDLFNVNIEKFIKDILSIIGGE